MSRPVVQGALLAAMAVAAVGLTTGSCASSPDPSRYTVIQAPDYGQFKGTNGNGVNDFITHRCGTLDCHGQVGRPLRLYSNLGLRLLNDAQATPGGSLSSEDEITANYQSVIGLQPELLSQVVSDPTNNPPQSLLLIAKPRNLQVHKGGQVVTAGDDGDQCLTTWVLGQVNATACQNAANAYP
jgi:hypothetical protein